MYVESYFISVTNFRLACLLIEGWCESDMDSEELSRYVRVHTVRCGFTTKEMISIFPL